MTIDARVMALCSEFGVTIIPKHRQPRVRETRAVGTIRKMIEQGGMETARLVMQTLLETENNQKSLESEVIGATFDLVRACREHFDDDPEKWFQVWDRCPVDELQAQVHDLRGSVPLRPALAGLIYERIWRAYGPRSIQPDLLDDRTIAP